MKMIPPLQSSRLLQVSQNIPDFKQQLCLPGPLRCPSLHGPGGLGYLDKLISGVCLSCKNNLLPDSKLV